MNFIQIAGHLGADPEVRFTSTGKKVTILRVAARSRKAGKDHTLWWRVTIWGEQYDSMIPHLKKGSAIIVSGTLEAPEIYNNREGTPQVSMNITASYLQFSPFGKTDREGMKSTQDSGNQVPYEMAGQAANSSSGGGSAPSDQQGFDDEVPF
ncbi:MAG: single-stranded DNA-binding protein [Chlamydiota bacterium]